MIAGEQKGIYYLFTWGGIENNDLPLSKFGELGNYWFSTSEQRKCFKKQIKRLAEEYNKGVCFREEDGIHTWKKTIAVMDMVYREKTYQFEYDFGYGYSVESAKYMFEDGNYACDCNKSIFLGEFYPEDFSEELECGELISIARLNIRFDD